METYTLLLRAGPALLISFAVAVMLSPIVISSALKLKVGQPILSYVEQHADKQGTPTFGGIIFLFPALFVTIAFTSGEGISIGTIAAIVMLSFAVLGFLDDFIKVKMKDNMGLRPYQKIIGQIAIAVIVSVYAYQNADIGSSVIIPFFGITFELGIWYIPFAAFVFLALSNCVNLTDGIDGLASNCSLVYFITFIVVLFFDRSSGSKNDTLIIFASATVGGLLAFLLVNTNKASVFMGDTGSMALGGASAALALFSKRPLLVLFVGIMYVVSGISIILQVAYFKITHGKRIFLMSPYHHHLEKKGKSEAQICNLYATVSLLMGVISIISVAVEKNGF